MNKLPLYTLAVGLLALTACGNDASSPTPVDAGNADTGATGGVETAVAEVTIEPKNPGVDFPDAAIEDWTYESGHFSVDYDSSSYVLGEQSPNAGSTMCANSAKGQHIHLIVDNEPYDAFYTAEFDREIPDGEHEVLAFLSRSYHESIKTEDAHRAVRANVEGGSFVSAEPITEPMLFYSRPKGTYTGEETENLLLDFYPVNADLGDDFRVKVEIDGDVFTLDEWQPYIIKGLPMGENTVTLTLVDAEGNTVRAPHNPVSRTFTLAADPMPGK